MMHIKAETLDDLLVKTFKKVLKSSIRTRSSRGPARELMAHLITLENPRARFSRTEERATLFSCLGETLWYVSGSNRLHVVEYYIPSYKKFAGLTPRSVIAPGAYGPRIFGGKPPSQIQIIIDMLQNKKDTRQAVIQIFAARDLHKKDVPCTCTLQFMPRGGKLHMLTNMRSNDAYRGLPHDVFAFTLMQEIVARSAGLEIGTYHHSVGSLHLYDSDEARAREYLDEGWQARIAMPAMPVGDPWPSLKWLLQVEERLRQRDLTISAKEDVDPYWIDLARLLRIKALLSRGDKREIVREKNAMRSEVYDQFIRGRAKARMIDVDDPQLHFSELDPDRATSQGQDA
ncbi:MAG: thymidylate synthase [Hyphomicrobiaceae bacterium]